MPFVTNPLFCNKNHYDRQGKKKEFLSCHITYCSYWISYKAELRAINAASILRVLIEKVVTWSNGVLEGCMTEETVVGPHQTLALHSPCTIY